MGTPIVAIYVFPKYIQSKMNKIFRFIILE